MIIKMQTIQDLINKIKWDKRENPDDYRLYYFDRVSDREIEISFNDIKEVEGSFLVIKRDDEEVNIPLHRIRAVKKKEEIVWKRL